MRRIFLGFLTTLLFPCCAIAEVCGGGPGEKAGSYEMIVHLKPPPSESSFYYRVDLFSVLFIPSNTLIEYLGKDLKDADSPRGRLLALIKKDVPLTENRDLFGYNLVNWDYVRFIDNLMLYLTEEGMVSLVSIGGHPVEKVTIVYDRRPKISTTTVYAGKRGINQILGRYDCIAD
jgi:hypothetical protein